MSVWLTTSVCVCVCVSMNELNDWWGCNFSSSIEIEREWCGMSVCNGHLFPYQSQMASSGANYIIYIYIYIYSAVGDRHTRITPGTPAGIINLISRLLAPSIIGCLSLRTFQDNQRIIERPVGPIESAIERKIIISIISVIVNAFS